VACFHGVTMKSPKDTVRWIVLKFLHEFLQAVFLGVAVKLLLNTNTVWLGKTKDHTRVPDQEVRNS
jgi:hypothetical protein